MMLNRDPRDLRLCAPGLAATFIVVAAALVACAAASDPVGPCELLADFFNGAPVSEVAVAPYNGGNERLLNDLLAPGPPAQPHQPLTPAATATLRDAIGKAASCGAGHAEPAHAPFRVEVAFKVAGADSAGVIMICKICKTAVLAVRHGATTRVSREFSTDGAERALDAISTRYRESVPQSGG
jgi:hypothetical protein